MFDIAMRAAGRAALGFGLVAAAGIAGVGAKAEEIVARLGCHWAPAHHSAIYSQEFADRANERGKGKIRIETFPSGQLFGFREIMGALTAGAVELGGVVGAVSFPPVNRNYNVEALPGAFDSFEHLRGFFRGTETGQQVWNDIPTRTRTHFVACNPTGPLMTFKAVRPLTSPEAYNGLKARYLSGVERPRWSALGADAISMPTQEVYTALQNGMIDTFATVPSAIKACSWWDYVKFAELPAQFCADSFILANQGRVGPAAGRREADHAGSGRGDLGRVHRLDPRFLGRGAGGVQGPRRAGGHADARGAG